MPNHCFGENVLNERDTLNDFIHVSHFFAQEQKTYHLLHRHSHLPVIHHELHGAWLDWCCLWSRVYLSHMIPRRCWINLHSGWSCAGCDNISSSPLRRTGPNWYNGSLIQRSEWKCYLYFDLKQHLLDTLLFRRSTDDAGLHLRCAHHSHRGWPHLEKS